MNDTNPADRLSETVEYRESNTGQRDAPAAECKSFAKPGHYTILQLHARGGLGQVSRARDEQLHRQVALKEIRPELKHDPSLCQRFLTEAEITGQLEHPGIVPVYALDEDRDGKPFYVMRFIEGQTFAHAITAYHASPSTLVFRKLLQNFSVVCQTIAYAHSKGVIHRDLKPDNIMLGDFGETLVLDWGLAKRLNEPIKSAPAEGAVLVSEPIAEAGEPSATVAYSTPAGQSVTALTAAGQVLGTPAYMAPEQATGDARCLSTALDIYALGAILYRLLSGRPPYVGKSHPEILDQLRHVDPPSLVQVRRSVPRALAAICQKAMARNPEDRHGDAGELAREVERFLADEPVLAYQEPMRVRAGRWVRRHTTLVTSAAAILVTVLGLSLWSSYLLGKANALTAVQRDRAEREAATARAVNTFLVDDLLGVADPDQLGPKMTILQALAAAVPRIEKAFAQQPEIEGELRYTIGNVYLKLAQHDNAEKHLHIARELWRRERGPEDPRTLNALVSWADLVEANGKPMEAESLLRETVQIRTRVQTQEDPDSLNTRLALAAVLRKERKLDEAEALYRDCLAVSRANLGPEHRVTLAALNGLGTVLQGSGRLAEAGTLFRELLDSHERLFGSRHPGTLVVRHNLAFVLEAQGQLDQAEPLLKQSLDEDREVLGPEHPQTLSALNTWGHFLKDQGKTAEAVEVFRQCWESRKKTLGPQHPDTLDTLNNLGVMLQRQWKWQEAERLLRDCLDSRTQVLGELDSQTLTTEYSLAYVLQGLPALAEAEKRVRHCLDGRKQVLGDGHAQTLETANLLGVILYKRERMADAELVLRDCLERRRRVLGPKAPPTLETQENLGVVLADLRKYTEAEPLFRDVLQLKRQRHGAQDMRLAQTLFELGTVLVERSIFQEAEVLLAECLQIQRQGLPKLDARLADTLVALGRARLEQGEANLAEPCFREAAEIRHQVLQGHWLTASVDSLVGACLVARGEYAQAEPLLLKGYQGLRAAKGAPAMRQQQARDSIIKLYEAWQKPEKAAEWKKGADRDIPQ
jgi:non-specific serine/threonine protein kinase/serine/threonine-protein kinase